MLLPVRMAEFLEDDDLLAIYVITSANKIRKKMICMDERLAPETREVGSYEYFTGIAAISRGFLDLNKCRKSLSVVMRD